jgi:hypothetical protein
MIAMAFVFTRTPLDEALLPQMAHALKTRIDSLSRLKYPAMWEQADRAAAKDTPEKKASREKAAAIIAAHGMPMRHIYRHIPSLEDVFVEMTRRD